MSAVDLLLHTWFSPAFPIGAYTYSHGLEWAIEDGTVSSRDDLVLWLKDSLHNGAGRNDAIFLAGAIRSFTDHDRLFETAELALAFQPSAERLMESVNQGRAFISAGRATWGTEELDAALEALEKRGISDDKLTLPVAAGLLCAAHEIPAEKALPLAVQAFAANLVSAAVRAVPLGQTDGLKCLRALETDISMIADAALTATLDDVGGMVFRSDIASMKHETQYTRLFRS